MDAEAAARTAEGQAKALKLKTDAELYSRQKQAEAKLYAQQKEAEVTNPTCLLISCSFPTVDMMLRHALSRFQRSEQIAALSRVIFGG